MEPIPAAAPPHQGPKIQPDSSTQQSPRFTNPCMGEGICTTMVATYVSAAIRAASTIFLIFMSLIGKISLRFDSVCIIVKTGIIEITILILFDNTR